MTSPARSHGPNRPGGSRQTGVVESVRPIQVDHGDPDGLFLRSGTPSNGTPGSGVRARPGLERHFWSV